MAKKEWRNRDAEFENDIQSKAEMLKMWEKRWLVLFDALNQVNDANINSIILIRGEKISVVDALLRQLAHYPYHIGQIIYLAKMLKNDDWKTLSIARNKSQEYTELLKAEFCRNSPKILHPFVTQKVMKYAMSTKQNKF